MTKVDIDVKYVAHLARLSLSPEEEQKISAQLGDILGYIEKLKEVDVAGVEPTAHAFPLVNVTRPDEAGPDVSVSVGLASQGRLRVVREGLPAGAPGGPAEGRAPQRGLPPRRAGLRPTVRGRRLPAALDQRLHRS